MKAYKIVVHDRDDGLIVGWEGSLKAAMKRLNEMVAEQPQRRARDGAWIKPILVPTGKPGLLAWLNLNLHFQKDNG